MKTFDQIGFKRTIIVAYRLPFKLIKKKNGYTAQQNSGGLVSAILSLSEKKNNESIEKSKILWVGTGDLKLGEKNLNQKFDLFPIVISKKINDKFYGGFCNDTIWPLFHYFPQRTTFDESYFSAYQEANNIYMQKLKEIIQPGDFIWIHDYHLLLLPNLVRQAFPNANIGFFLHIPFPSFEIFRLVPKLWRESILEGMTGADVVGFHTNDYSLHFLKSIKRTLGHKINNNHIYVNNRLCKADSFPIGIDFDKFHEACTSPKTIFQKQKLRKYLSDKKLVFSIDRLDYSKGLINRLISYERFLEKYPAWHYKVVFNMVIIPSRDNIEAYREIKREIEAIVGRINGKYSNLSWRPVIYQYKSLNFNELVALYDLSDVGLITPLRDGMNLVAKEYIACQKENPGMLILSEMAGAAVELNEAIIINPSDIEETTDAIDKALNMPMRNKKGKVLKMQNRLKRYNVFKWAADFYSQVDEIKKVQNKMKVKYINENTLLYIKEKFQKSKKRLFLFDYDGTLTPIANQPEKAILNYKTKELLKNIASDKRNTIVIISGRKCEFIANQFNSLDVILVAEHGYFLKMPGKPWLSNMELSNSWKKKILPILDDYVDRCSGSIIEEKVASIAWHYRNVEEEIATLRINELKDDLTEVLKSKSNLQMLEGNKVLEVKSLLYNKGSAGAALLNQAKYDFVLAMGDDETDEDLFKVIPKSGITIKVGTGPSNAQFNISNQMKIYQILSLFEEEPKIIMNKLEV